MPVPSYKVITYGWDRHAGLQHDAALLHQELVDLGHSAVVLRRPSYRTFSWRVLMSRRVRALRADWSRARSSYFSVHNGESRWRS